MRKYIWSWYDGKPMKENQVGSITMVAMKEFNEVGKYSIEEVWLLDWVLHNTVPPIWLPWEWRKDGTCSQDNNIQMALEYNELIMNKFKELNVLTSS